MLLKRCYGRIEGVVQSYRTVLKTVDVVIQLAQNDPKYLHVNKLELNALRALTRELHDVYFARIFACFESDLRHYWRATVRDTKPTTEQLLSSIADRRNIPQDMVDAVQKVREFRNHLIHEQHEVVEPIAIDDAIKCLRAYLSRLPPEW